MFSSASAHNKMDIALAIFCLCCVIFVFCPWSVVWELQVIADAVNFITPAAIAWLDFYCSTQTHSFGTTGSHTWSILSKSGIHGFTGSRSLDVHLCLCFDKKACRLAEAISKVNIEVIIISTIINNLWHNRSCDVNTHEGGDPCNV